MNGVFVGWCANGQCVDWGRERETAGACGLHSYLFIYLFLRLCFFLFMFIYYTLPFFLYVQWLLFLLSLYVLFLFCISPNYFFTPVFLSSLFYFLPSFFSLSEFCFSPSFLLVYLQAIWFLQNSSFLGHNTTLISRQIKYRFHPLLAAIIRPI